jgi:hypothetical protein
MIAVLVGVAAYRNMAQLPATLNNLTDLSERLGAGCTVIADPESADAVLAPLARAAKASTATLVFYFAGHGVRDADNALCLALPHTVDRKDDAQRTALPFERVAEILNRSRIRNRIVVLDCCFSALAMRAPSAFDLHLLTATGRNERALSPPGKRNTLFTGALLDLMRRGVPEAEDWITLGDLYRWAGSGAEEPTPHQRAVDTSAELPLVRNPGAGPERRAELAVRVGWKDPSRAARLFQRLAAETGRLDFRMSAAAWRGTAGDGAGALGEWEAIRAQARDPEDVTVAEASIRYWRERLGSRGEPELGDSL